MNALYIRWPNSSEKGHTNLFRLRVVPHFPSRIVERAKRERTWKSPKARKARWDGKRIKWKSTDKAQLKLKGHTNPFRLRVVLHFPSGIVERAKCVRAWKSLNAKKAGCDWERGKWGTIDKAQALMFFSPRLGFCTLCFSFPTKMLHLNAPFFPLKCSVSPKKVTKMLG